MARARLCTLGGRSAAVGGEPSDGRGAGLGRQRPALARPGVADLAGPELGAEGVVGFLPEIAADQPEVDRAELPAVPGDPVPAVLPLGGDVGQLVDDDPGLAVPGGDLDAV